MATVGKGEHRFQNMSHAGYCVIFLSSPKPDFKKVVGLHLANTCGAACRLEDVFLSFGDVRIRR